MANKLDFRTRLFLFITCARIVKHPEVVKVEEKLEFNEKANNKKDVYVFDSFDEYRNFFKMYIDDFDDELIDLAIYTRTDEGIIVALKELCCHIIQRKKMNANYGKIFTK